MKKAYIIAGFIWISLSCLVVVEAWKLGVGTFVGPGPGFVPFGAALLLGVLAVVSLFQAFLDKGVALSGFKGVDLVKILLVNIVLVAGVLLWDMIGFFPVTLLLLIFMFRVLKPLGWGRVVTAAVLTMAFTWVLFVEFLGLRLPQGSIWKFFIN